MIYFEEGDSIEAAIAREKQLKNWERKWKMDLIKEKNPDLEDLAKGWHDEEMLKGSDPETSSGLQYKRKSAPPFPKRRIIF